MDRKQTLAASVAFLFLLACGPELSEREQTTPSDPNGSDPTLSVDAPAFRGCAFGGRAEALLNRARGQTNGRPLAYLFRADVHYGDSWVRVGYALTGSECGLVEFRQTTEPEEGTAPPENQAIELLALTARPDTAEVVVVDADGPLAALVGLRVDSREELGEPRAIRAIHEALVVDADGPQLVTFVEPQGITVTPISVPTQPPTETP